ncbi:MAG: hypothetical protein ACLS29_00530 [Prevotellamassilia sp.]
MKILRTFCIVFSFLIVGTLVAQPPRRRAEMQNKQQAQQTPQGSAYRQFPTAQVMPKDAAWRRDLYRKLDLNKEANATLYYPTTPQDGRENLLLPLQALLRKQIKAYDYKLDGNEDFSQKNLVTAKDLMDRYHIFYESKGDKVRVTMRTSLQRRSSILHQESTYYDQHTASFRSQVTALCRSCTQRC